MNLYTISADFVEHCGPCYPENWDYWYNVLAIFNQDNEYKLCIDNQKQAISIYIKQGEHYEQIRFWLQALLTSPNKNIELISLPKIESEDPRILFISIAAKTVCLERKLVVCNKQDYDDVMHIITDKNVIILDRDEAKARLAPRKGNIQIAIGDNINQNQ